MKTNGHNQDEMLVGWPNDARLARIVIHIDVAQSIFDHGLIEHRREFKTPQEMFDYAEALRERQRRPAPLSQILRRGLKAFPYFTRKKGG